MKQQDSKTATRKEENQTATQEPNIPTTKRFGSAECAKRLKSAAPVAGVSETMSKVCPKLEGLALPYPPTDVAHCAGHPP